MSRHIICSVGTSLLINLGWRRGQPLPEAAQVDAALRQQDPRRTSAETNTLHALEVSSRDVLDLLHSETDEGRFCAERLCTFYAREVAAVQALRIESLGYGEQSFPRGLRGLVDLTLRCVRQAHDAGRQAVLCATGGFKAEIAYLTLLGALLELEVVYMHELHRELIVLPRLPLQWDAAFVERHRRFFEWIDEAPRASHEVESRLHGAPELRSLVRDDDDGHTYLTAAGDLLFRVAHEQLALGPRATWPEADPRPPADKNQVSSVEHHRPRGWEAFVRRLCAIDCVRAVRYDGAAHGSERVQVLDPDDGAIAVRFGTAGDTLPLRVETTARGAGQSGLVARYLETLR